MRQVDKCVDNVNSDLLRAAVRRARDAGMTYEQAWRVLATEYGAVYRENAIDGWKPVAKTFRVPAAGKDGGKMAALRKGRRR